MHEMKWIRCVGMALALGASACGATPPSEQTEVESDALSAGPHLLLKNEETGEIRIWLFDGPTYVGYNSLDAGCGYYDATQCGFDWFLRGVRGSTLWWWGRNSTGEVSTWSFDRNNHVTFNPSLSWICDVPSGCASAGAWDIIGPLSLKPKTCPVAVCVSTQAVLWHNHVTGELSLWLLAQDGLTVMGTQTLSYTCANSTRCAYDWSTVLIADLDGDGSDDLLWHNNRTDELSAWLIKDTSGQIKDTQTIRNIPAGYSVGEPAADVNGDGHVDLLLRGPGGALANGFLDGRGNVIGTQTLSRTCGASCSHDWRIAGYVTYPGGPPR